MIIFRKIPRARRLFIAALAILFSSAHAQDSVAVDKLNDGASLLSERVRFDSSITVAERALAIANDIQYLAGRARAYSILGNAYDHIGNYLKALEAHFRALKLRQQIGDKKAIAGSYNNIGLIYYGLDNYAEALRYNEIALKIKREIGDKAGISGAYNNMANVLADQGKYPQALENYRQSLEISREIDHREGIAEAYLNMGILYEEMGVFDSSQRNLEIALAMHRQLGDLMSESTTCQSLGALFVKMGRPALAKEWLIKGLEMARTSGARDEMKYCYRDLAAADSALGDLKGAFFNYQRYILYRDSLVNEDNTRRSVRQQMQFEFDLRESEARIDQQKKDTLALAASQRQRVIIAAISTGLAIILVLSIVTLRSLRVNQKKNHIIEVQKHAVERQKDIIEQKQKEMLDSIRYAKRIQQALITNEHYIHKNLRRLRST